MSSVCCGHTDKEHHLTSMCQDLIHYPSEDYPCLCIGFESGEKKGVCRNCSHRKDAHAWARVCRPSSTEVCGCSKVMPR